MKTVNVIRIEKSDRGPVIRCINGAIRSAIAAHGPITLENYHSASHRVLDQLAAYERELNKYERKRQLKQRALRLFE